MSYTSIQQWKCALGSATKKLAYVLGAIAFVGALVVSRLVRAHVAGALDAEIGRPVAFGASFLAYLLVIGAGGVLVHYAVWRVGDHLTQAQEELTWETDETQTQTRPRARLTSSTPVP